MLFVRLSCQKLSAQFYVKNKQNNLINMDSEAPTDDSEYLDAVEEQSFTDAVEDHSGSENFEDEEQGKYSIISEIRELNIAKRNNKETEDDNKSTSNEEVASSSASEDLKIGKVKENTDHDYLHDIAWKLQKKHIFILSEAGKPIYTLHGSEDKLATLFGIIQALVSFVQHGQDAISSIIARGIKFVFLTRNSLILVAASRTAMSTPQLQMQLSDVYNQILSTLTFSHMNKIFEKRKNFDLRRLLAGSERLIYHLLANESSNKRVTNNVFTFLTNSIRVLPLPVAVRYNITSAIQSNCSKIKNLVFAVLLAKNKLIAIVRMKKYSIHPADLRLIFNLIDCSESFKTSENWTPICLPKFDMNGYLHAHVSYLADDCQACLLLLSVDRDDFFTLSDAKKRITEKLRRSHSLEAINEELNKRVNTKLNLSTLGIPELRHFLYKPRALPQLLCAELMMPYVTLKEFERLEAIYCDLIHRIHNNARPLKLIFEVQEREAVLAWVTATYELYIVFEPMVDKNSVIKYVDKLMKSIEKEHDVFFIRNHPTF